MAGVELIITADLEPLQDQLTRLSSGLAGDLTPVMETLGNLWENSTRARFESKTDPDGNKWADWSEATKYQRRKSVKVENKTGDGFHWQKTGEPLGELMIDKRLLVDSITHHASADRVIVGTNQTYGIYHQTGTKYMPARSFAGLSDTDIEDGQDVLNHHILELLT